MKKLLSLIVTLLLVFNPVVLAAETSEEVEAGTTPDSPMWGLERAMERISMAFTFGKAAKAEKGLIHARERLAEIKVMTEAKNIEKAEKAKEAHERIMAGVEENINDLSEDPEEELISEIDIEKALIQHSEDLAGLGETVNARIGQMTNEERQKVDAYLENLESKSEKAMEKIRAKREKTRVKLKTKLGKSDSEVDAIEDQAEKTANIERLREQTIAKAAVRIEKQITNLKNIAAKAKEQGKDVSSISQRLDDAESLLNQVKSSKDKSIGEVKEAVQEINKLLNFRKTYIAVESNDIKARLQLLEAKAVALKAKAEAKLEEAEKIRERIQVATQQRLTQAEEGEKEQAETQTQNRQG